MRRAFAILVAFGAATVAAEPLLKARVIAPSPGMASDDQILCTADATEYGADKTGERDSTQAIQDALDACVKATGGIVFLPAGRYRVDGRLVVKGGVTLRGEWVNPEQGGVGKGTILMARLGRGNESPTDQAFLRVHGASCLRDLSVWYPEQSPSDPVPYPATIHASGHSTIYNITLYNSWTGFWNNDCSSMLIRRLYGTVLKLGVHGAYAYDIPRIEHVHFSPRFWTESRLPGAPAGASLAKLKAFLAQNLVGIQGGEQDWGYWWDLDIDWCARGLYLTAIPSDDGKKLVPGNICAGNVKIRNATVGIHVENAGYPGFMLTYGDISARTCGLYFANKPDYVSRYGEVGEKVSYQRGSTLLVTGVAFHGGRYAVASAKKGPYGVNLNDCTFDGYTQAGVRSSTGSITVTRSRFLAPRVPAFKMEDAVDQLVLVGNSFAARNVVTGCAANDPRIYRDDREKDVPAAMKYTFDHVPRRKPSASRVWDVSEFGAARGSYEEPPARDSTAAFQKALDAAGKARGGTVYVPAGIYRLDGALKVPHGVELRGCFSGAHYGNGTSAGTILWVYGGKDKPDAEPLVTLAPGSGFRGFTVFYPEQGWTDREGADEEARVKKYPPTVRTASGCWVQDNTIVCCWDAIDAMTVKSDNLEIVDVTGAAMGSTLLYGHGAVDGVVRNLHFNYSNWTHQGKFPNRPHGGDDLTQYTGRCVKGLVLGDLRRCAFFSCFNILVSDQIVLERDRYTGRSFLGKTWGIAFDAAHNGVVGKAGCEAVIGLIASMGVFNQQGGGHYVVTEPGFKGHVVLSNADVWSGHSRIADGAEAYIFNGYESMKDDNISGCVDCYRNHKGRTELVSQYMKPLVMSVKAREKLGATGDTNLFDLWVLNNYAIPAGTYRVRAGVKTPTGKVRLLHAGEVKVSGGAKFSDLAAKGIAVKLDDGPGLYSIRAQISDAQGRALARGHNEMFAVAPVPGRINAKVAIVGGGPEYVKYAESIGARVQPYDPQMGRLDGILLAPTDLGQQFKPIPSFNFRAKDGVTPGLNLDHFLGKKFETPVGQRVSTAAIDFDLKAKLIPGYDIIGLSNFSVRWEGYVVCDYTGEIEFEYACDDGASVWFDGALVVDKWTNGPKQTRTFKKNLVAGKKYALKIEAYQDGGDWLASFKWKLPLPDVKCDLPDILRRVREDGTKLVLVEDAETWLKKLREAKAFPEYKVFHPHKTWVGHNLFVKEHPFFAGLPVNCAMNWEYQKLVVYDGPKHFGLEMDGEEALVGIVGVPLRGIATSVGIVPYGKGKIVFSSLDIAPNLASDDKSAVTPKRFYANILHWTQQGK